MFREKKNKILLCVFPDLVLFSFGLRFGQFSPSNKTDRRQHRPTFSQLAAKGSPKRPKDPRRAPKDVQKTPKGDQRAPKVDQKTTKVGPKGAKGDQKTTKVGPKGANGDES